MVKVEILHFWTLGAVRSDERVVVFLGLEGGCQRGLEVVFCPYPSVLNEKLC